MATITSDTETDVESVMGSSYSAASASKEQISTILNKLQGRAANYKEKYREVRMFATKMCFHFEKSILQLASSYRTVLGENEKIRVKYFNNWMLPSS